MNEDPKRKNILQRLNSNNSIQKQTFNPDINHNIPQFDLSNFSQEQMMQIIMNQRTINSQQNKGNISIKLDNVNENFDIEDSNTKQE